MNASRTLRHSAGQRIPRFLAGVLVVLVAFAGLVTPSHAEADEPPLPGKLQAGFSWSLARYDDRNGDGWADPARNFADAHRTDWPVKLDGCYSSVGSSPIVGYIWNLNGTEVRRECSFTWLAPGRGKFPVVLTVEAADGSRHSQTQLVSVHRDLVLASVGDSLASGQGNPHATAPQGGPVWEDTRCHRSEVAGSAQAAAHIEGADPSTSVTFVHLGCSGAKIIDPSSTTQGGLLDSYEGSDDAYKSLPPLPPQVQQLKKILGQRPIDALLLSVGINDLEFGTIVETCIHDWDCREEMEAVVQDRLGSLPGRYQQLATELQTVFPGLAPAKVFLNQYPDPTRREDGNLCEAMVDEWAWTGAQIDRVETQWAATVISRLNDAVADAADAHGWTLINGVAERYQRNGECTEDSWFVHLQESADNQENDYGTLHPNAMGHAQLRARLLEVVKPEIPTGPPRIYVNGVAPGGTYLTGTAPMVLVHDPIGLEVSRATLDGVRYTSGSQITTAGSHTLVVQGTNNAGLRSKLTLSFTLVAPTPSLTLTPASVQGGDKVTGRLVLNGTAPAGGVTVTLSTNNWAATPPATLVFPEGSSTATFEMTTAAVANDTPLTIWAATGGATTSANVTVNAPRVKTLIVHSDSVTGGSPLTTTVYLTGRAPASGLHVPLSSSHDGIVPVAGETIFIPGNETWGSRSIPTRAVPTETQVSLTGSYLNSNDSRSFWVYPATVQVPWVLELPERYAVEDIRAAGLVPRVLGPSGDPNAWVRSQSPQGGTVVNSGSTVTIELSTSEPL